MNQVDMGGIATALIAALLFGASPPLAKLLLVHTNPWLLAALLYLGSGLGLLLLRRLWRVPAVSLPGLEWGWLAGAILAGGVVAPVLLLLGLARMPASGASLLLNAEGVFTAFLAWFVFHENFDRRVALGMVTIVAGALVLSWPGEASFAGSQAALLVLSACLAWAVDNNLTRKVSLADASFIAMTKGLAAGATNLALALALHAPWPAPGIVTGALFLGLASYGASLILFVVALRHLGTARTGAYFSVAPFLGTLLAIALLQEPITPQLTLAGALMLLGVWLHLTERHEHPHVHKSGSHEHTHYHGDDPHHDHPHDPPVAAGTRHRHSHVHRTLQHSHPHFPDMHHEHRH